MHFCLVMKKICQLLNPCTEEEERQKKKKAEKKKLSSAQSKRKTFQNKNISMKCVIFILFIYLLAN